MDSDSYRVVSFVLLAYNHEDNIAEAVDGAVSQTYQPLELLLSDDCPEDRTFETMCEMADAYQGPHTVRLNRNEHNLGLISHVNRAVELATGELLVMGARDHVSLPSRVEDVVKLWLDGSGQPEGLTHGVSNRQGQTRCKPFETDELSVESFIEQGTAGTMGAWAAWTRLLFEYRGPLPNVAPAEDQTLAFWVLLRGGMLFGERREALYGDTPGATDRSLADRLASMLWRMKRRPSSYEFFESEVVSLAEREPNRRQEVGRFRARLPKRTGASRREIGWLERASRLDGLAYGKALLRGTTFSRGPFCGRLWLSMSVRISLTFGGARVSAMEPENHYGNRMKARQR